MFSFVGERDIHIYTCILISYRHQLKKDKTHDDADIKAEDIHQMQVQLFAYLFYMHEYICLSVHGKVVHVVSVLKGSLETCPSLT